MTGLAKQLWEARAAGYTIDAAEFDLPSTLAEAYAVQDAVCSLSGFRRAGYKVGSTSEEAQCLLGTAEPGAGALLQPYVYESPAKIAIVSANMPAVEGEFAFRMARDLPCAGILAVLSGNTHDKSVEVAMTSALVGGPIGAVIGCVGGFLTSRSEAQ